MAVGRGVLLTLELTTAAWVSVGGARYGHVAERRELESVLIDLIHRRHGQPL